MRKTLALLTVALAVGLGAATDADAARRLGGGKSSGMHRESVTAPSRAPAATPQPQPASPSQAAPAAAPNAAAAAQPSRSRWLGPIAGLAAGLGIAALASHFGFGEALANMLTFALIAVALLALVGFILRRRSGSAGQPAWAGAGAGSTQASQPPVQRSAADQPRTMIGSGIAGGIGSGIGSGIAAGAASAAPAQIPADFDTLGFARNAKDNFLQLQAANDAGDLERLRGFLTPQMFEEVSRDIATRGNEPQRTEVFGLDAQVLQVVEEAADWIASVRFTGRIRHEAGAVPEDFDEVWHLSKPRAGAGGWVIAGIQQA